jgi:hypothetical protein
LIVDLKTTSARSYGEFLKSCEDYGYDGSCFAIWMDAGSRRFVILGVQKQAPYEVFYFEASAARGASKAVAKSIRDS